MYIECLINTRGLPFCWYILQEERIIITAFIFKIISERREGREEGREKGNSR